MRVAAIFGVAAGLRITTATEPVRMERPVLVPIVREGGSEETQGLVAAASNPAANSKSTANPAGFQAVANQSPWPAGLVPMYGMQTDGHFDLRRQPPPGGMDQAEPVFFALPDDSAAADTLVCGTWDCRATHPDGQRKRVSLDLVAEGSEIAARFDPNSDYRFASIASGSFRSNRLHLTVQYVNNRFEIDGVLKAGTLEGQWRQADGGDAGTWQGRRWAPALDLAALKPPAPLCEYLKEGTGARFYTTDAAWKSPGWHRSDKRLCRVWPAPR